MGTQENSFAVRTTFAVSVIICEHFLLKNEKKARCKII